MHPVVTAEWLSQHLNDETLIILDSSPVSTVDGSSSEFANQTIPGARSFDLKNNFSDPDSAFPNTLPSEEQFQEECQKLGINASSTIVVFDNLGVYTSPRVWWMFKVMGHKEVYVLDGGLPAWITAGFETEVPSSYSGDAGDFTAKLNPEYVISYEQIVANSTECTFEIVDARSSGRFNGTAPEPRTNLQSGSIPNSVNIPYQEVLEGGKFKSPEALKKIFAEQSSADKELVFSCGSGLTACIVLLASEIAGNPQYKVFDGSWTEWAERQQLFTSL